MIFCGNVPETVPDGVYCCVFLHQMHRLPEMFHHAEMKIAENNKRNKCTAESCLSIIFMMKLNCAICINLKSLVFKHF